jgi:hypothetical protein
MTNEPNELRADLEADAREGDEPVEPEVREELPDHLDLPLEVPEADKLEQELDVPIDDEER